MIACGTQTKINLSYNIKVATLEEKKSLASLPVFAGNSKALKRKVERGDVLIAKENSQIIGLLVAELYGFFDENTVSMVIVDSNCRRKGVGTALVTKAEEIFSKGKLFMATNKSNIPMQKLCTKMGYKKVGHIENIVEDDPELIYLKRL